MAKCIILYARTWIIYRDEHYIVFGKLVYIRTLRSISESISKQRILFKFPNYFDFSLVELSIHTRVLYIVFECTSSIRFVDRAVRRRKSWNMQANSTSRFPRKIRPGVNSTPKKLQNKLLGIVLCSITRSIMLGYVLAPWPMDFGIPFLCEAKRQDESFTHVRRGQMATTFHRNEFLILFEFDREVEMPLRKSTTAQQALAP